QDDLIPIKEGFCLALRHPARFPLAGGLEKGAVLRTEIADAPFAAALAPDLGVLPRHRIITQRAEVDVYRPRFDVVAPNDAPLAQLEGDRRRRSRALQDQARGRRSLGR